MFTRKNIETVDFYQLEPQSVSETFRTRQYDEKPSFGFRRLLKRNPSLEFCREVVQMNKQELDLAEVRKVGS
jgi:hypothetical protein